jgi:hypothetical protein
VSERIPTEFQSALDSLPVTMRIPTGIGRPSEVHQIST